MSRRCENTACHFRAPNTHERHRYAPAVPSLANQAAVAKLRYMLGLTSPTTPAERSPFCQVDRELAWTLLANTGMMLAGLAWKMTVGYLSGALFRISGP
eukprot:3739522-Pyramimonas_sp.AAC.1